MTKLKIIQTTLIERIFKNYLTTIAGLVVIGVSLGLVMLDKIEPVDLTYVLPVAVVLFGLKDHNGQNNEANSCDK